VRGVRLAMQHGRAALQRRHVTPAIEAPARRIARPGKSFTARIERSMHASRRDGEDRCVTFQRLRGRKHRLYSRWDAHLWSRPRRGACLMIFDHDPFGMRALALTAILALAASGVASAGCTFEPVVQDGNSWRRKSTCNMGSVSSTSDSVTTADGKDAFTVTLDSVINGKKVHEVMQARRVGDCEK
jgi:hypothetical protein